MPIILCLTLLFCIWFRYERSKSSKTVKEIQSDFWEQERLANSTRKKDLTNLDYLCIDLSRLPMTPCSDTDITNYQTIIHSLVSQKILNLSNMDNTSLKTEYGVANFDTLVTYEENYYTLITTLDQWGNYLYNIHLSEDALLVLEYAIHCDSDIRTTYVTLGKLYLESKKQDLLQSLITTLKNQDTPKSLSIVKQLEEMIFHSYLMEASTE